MVYSSSGEQKMKFRVHNSSWMPVDFDGLKLMLHPLQMEGAVSDEEILKRSRMKAYRMHGIDKRSSVVKEKENSEKAGEERQNKQTDKEYVVIDIETTVLQPHKDDIIELAAIHVKEGLVVDEFNVLVYTDQSLSEEISRLTGITNEMIEDEGLYPKEALAEFVKYADGRTVVGHNVLFDMAFLDKACKEQDIKMFHIDNIVDTLSLSREKVKSVSDYKLTTLAQYFGVDISDVHSALGDCYLAKAVYQELKKM
ncbi:MAG: hypothetical protein LUE31_00035 [Lachnospiraceae bacterium]|nr:hypothetical protein [Lachnospiraceae bacterium]